MDRNKTSLFTFVFLSLLLYGCGMTQSPSSISPASAAIAPGQTIAFTAMVEGRSSGLNWFVNGVQGGNATAGMIDSNGNFTAPTTSQGLVATISAQSGSHSATASVAVIPPGQVTTTNNPQVALYTIAPPVSGSVSIQFSTDTSYNLTTWTQPATGNDTPLSIFIAGMRASTPYHMRAVMTLSNGAQFTDSDHIFTTGAINTASFPQISVSTPSGLTPQPGIEMINTINTPTQAFATDLSGNVIWSYQGLQSGDTIQPIKLLANGHMIINIENPTASRLLEVDLAGNSIRQLDIATLNQRLAAAGFNIVAATMHHDVTPLPNGHFLILVNMTKPFTNLPGFPGTTNVAGDQIIDLDPNWNPVWVWNSFDHLDINRHPMNFPDWTHSNAIIYSKDDGNIILSIRHQNWIIKINYNNGQGDGSILWHLGEGGDFKLVGGTDPTDWFWAQHWPNFASTNTTGVFSLAVFDDGDDRQLPAGTTGAPPQGNCLSSIACYSTGEVLQLDENAMTATITFHDFPNLYSFFGGNAEVLANGNLEYDLCAASPGGNAVVLELPQQENPRQIALQMNISGDGTYRAYRLPSLYPGVQW